MKIDTVHHDGRTFPVYPTESVIWSGGDICTKAREASTPTIVRGIRVDPWTIFNLNKLLRVADDIFESVANDCGATVVEHQWGLARAPLPLRYSNRGCISYTHSSLPLGMSLVAEVAIHHDAINVWDIKDAQYEELSSRIEEVVYSHRWTSPRSNDYVWTDGKSSQFMAEPQAQGYKLILTDIEPLIACKNGSSFGSHQKNISKII